MAKRRIHKLCPSLVAIAFASAAMLVSAQPASAASALFRAKRTWLFGGGSWTDGHVEPRTGKGSYEPPAVAGVGPTTPHPAFTAPKSFIKNTTYTYMCPYYYCGYGLFGILKSSRSYSYWNGRGNFRPQNPYAPTTTTTIRVRTTMDGYNPTLMGWPTTMRFARTVAGHWRNVTVVTRPPTAGFSRITPTEGGCTGPIAVALPPVGASCPGTTQFNGDYRHDRGGSIMIWPGGNRFGGTMRWFSGPNARFYQLITIDGPPTSVTFPPVPLSQQTASSVETRVGEVVAVPSSRAFHYQLTEPYHIERRVIGLTPSGAGCTLGGMGVFPDCRYLQKTAQYLATRAPYTTGMVQSWEPNGNTNTIQTATGYDNRTSMGLNGTISLVHPRLTHAYLIDRSIDPNKPIEMFWSAARMRKIDFRFLPEPRGIVLLVSGLAMLAGLYRLRRR